MTIEQPPVSMPADVVSALRAGAATACSVSGGKDGMAAALAVSRYLDGIGHAGPRILIHADLGRIEWRDSLPACERLAQHLGWELVVVRRSAGDMIDRWLTRWESSKRRYADLETVRLVIPWSTPGMRFCTSELKVAVIVRELKRRFTGLPIVNVTGIRRQESASRARKPASAPSKALSRPSAPAWDWNPVIDWSEQDVWAEIDASGVRPHEGYRSYGSSRISCSFCIMSSIGDLQASVSNPDHADIYRELVDLEIASSFGFQSNRWLGELAPALLRPDQVTGLARARQIAFHRAAIEARLPSDLLYTDGWPTRLPTPAEAELLAGVRREIAALMGMQVQFSSAAEVHARYQALMDQGAERRRRRSGPAARTPHRPPQHRPTESGADMLLADLFVQ